MKMELSKKEIEVIDLLMQGKKNEEIASTLSISVSSVKSRLNGIYKKYGVETRIAFAMKYKGFNELEDTDDFPPAA